jgi:hypothetical protein
MTVSVYSNFANTSEPQNFEFGVVLEAVKGGKWQEKVERVRSAIDTKEKEKLKKALPCVTISGTFSERMASGLIKHSGLICIDIDKDISHRKEIEEDPYTYACFASASGNGLAVIVKIDPAKHLDSFTGLEKYYKDRCQITIDKSCKDVSRLRFVSYDPDTYINENSLVFEVTSFFVSDFEKAVSAVESAGVNLTQDDYHRYLRIGFAIASECGEAGRDYFHRVCRLSSKYNEKNCDKQYNYCLRDKGAKKTSLGTFFHYLKEFGIKASDTGRFEIEYILRQKKREGESLREAVKELAAAKGMPAHELQGFAEKIYAEEMQKIQTFWYVSHDDKRDTYKLSINLPKYTKFLENAGFARFRVGKEYVPVRMVNHVVEEITRADIKGFVMDYIDSLPFEFDNIFRIELEDRVKTEHKKLFDAGIIEFLPEITEDFMRDTAASACYFYRNGFVEVTKSKIMLHPYTQLRKPIWKEQIMDRDFIQLPGEQFACEGNHFYRFMFNVSGQNVDRLKTLISAIGYLMHSYKSPSNPRVVTLVDEAISETPSGGTGKGLLMKAVGMMRETETLDGKNFDFKDKFALQGIKETTRIICFEDWDGKRLPFDKLFNMATTVMKVNRLYLGQVTIPYEDAPKIAISTNDMIVGRGSSYARRLFEVEIAPHYSDTHRPVDEFGTEFFYAWNKDRWAQFDNLMLFCVQQFLIGGLVTSKPVNLNRRKLLQATTEEFVSFCDELERGKEYCKKDLWQIFLDQYAYDPKQFTHDRFSKYLKKYAEYEELVYMEYKNRLAGLDQNKRFFTIDERKK